MSSKHIVHGSTVKEKEKKISRGLSALTSADDNALFTPARLICVINRHDDQLGLGGGGEEDEAQPRRFSPRRVISGSIARGSEIARGRKRTKKERVFSDRG